MASIRTDVPVAYLDTCIISGIARDDLGEESAALLECLELYKADRVHLVTSPWTKDEIDKVPGEHRGAHQTIYLLLRDVPEAREYNSNVSSMTLLGVSGASRPDPLLLELNKVLPDADDARHVFQAAKNSVSYFITTDRRTILRHGEAVLAVCGVRCVSPSDLLLALTLPPEIDAAA